MDIKDAWQRAYDLHYRSKNPDDKKQALILYNQISTEHPSSEQGKYSLTQIDNLKKSNPELFNPDSTIKNHLKSNDANGITPIIVNSDDVLEPYTDYIPLPPLPAYQVATRPLAILLTRYIGREIGINYKEPKEFSPAVLSQVTDDFLSVHVPEKQITVSYPLHHILNVTESEGGISTGFFFGKRYVTVIEVFHLIVYKGAFGVSIPM